jgi:hypothetical protein
VSSPERSGRHELEPVQLASPTRRNRNPPSDQELLHAVWLISHFGWIAEATIRRTLMISDAQRILATGLAERLRQLLNRGWVERRHNDPGTDELEWRLTDSGRDALAHRG